MARELNEGVNVQDSLPFTLENGTTVDLRQDTLFLMSGDGTENFSVRLRSDGTASICLPDMTFIDFPLNDLSAEETIEVLSSMEETLKTAIAETILEDREKAVHFINNDYVDVFVSDECLYTENRENLTNKLEDVKPKQTGIEL